MNYFIILLIYANNGKIFITSYCSLTCLIVMQGKLAINVIFVLWHRKKLYFTCLVSMYYKMTFLTSENMQLLVQKFFSKALGAFNPDMSHYTNVWFLKKLANFGKVYTCLSAIKITVIISSPPRV